MIVKEKLSLKSGHDSKNYRKITNSWICSAAANNIFSIPPVYAPPLDPS
jgi:hypothetical protein